MWVAFALQKLLTFFQQKKIQHICVSLDVNFNESLTNDIVSFEQLGPVLNYLNTTSCSNYYYHLPIGEHRTTYNNVLRGSSFYHDEYGWISLHIRQIHIIIWLKIIH